MYGRLDASSAMARVGMDKKLPENFPDYLPRLNLQSTFKPPGLRMLMNFVPGDRLKKVASRSTFFSFLLLKIKSRDKMRRKGGGEQGRRGGEVH